MTCTNGHQPQAAAPPSRLRRGQGILLALAAAAALAGCYAEPYDAPVMPRSCAASSGPGTDGLRLYGANNFSGLTNLANASNTMTLDAGTVEFNNPALSATSTTGSLRISLWAVPGSYNGGSFTGYSVASYAVQFAGGATQLRNGQSVDLVAQTLTSFTPPRGSYCMMIALEEYNPASCPADSDQYCVVDWVQFSTSSEFY